MGVVDAVGDHFAGAPALDQPQPAEDAQVLRDGRLGVVGDRGHFAGPQLLAEQAVDDLGAA
jgi:hypothetical protein